MINILKCNSLLYINTIIYFLVSNKDDQKFFSFNACNIFAFIFIPIFMRYQKIGYHVYLRYFLKFHFLNNFSKRDLKNNHKTYFNTYACMSSFWKYIWFLLNTRALFLRVKCKMTRLFRQTKVHAFFFFNIQFKCIKVTELWLFYEYSKYNYHTVFSLVQVKSASAWLKSI